MGVTIPLPELDLPKPAPAPPPDALAEFQRAASLQTAAAQQQAILAQAQGQQQQNQAQGLQLKDEQLRRSLAPKFVQKDENGKPTGFDNEGLYSAMLSGGADPLTIQKLRMSQVEMQKSLIGLSDAQIEHQKKINGEFFNSLESVRDIQRKTAPEAASTPQAPSSSVAAAPNPLGAPVPGTGGMPAGMLPNMPEAQDIGKSPAGSPASLGQSNDGTAPTSTESALHESAASAPRPISPQAQMAYQKELIRLSQMGIPVGKLKPMLTDESDLDQSEAELGLHAQTLAEGAELAKTSKEAGEGAKAQAEAKKANIVPMPEMGGVYHVDTGEFTTVAGQAMSPAMLEGRYVMNQAQKNAGHPITPEQEAFDKSYERMKTLNTQFKFNLESGAGGQAKLNPQQDATKQAIIEGRQTAPTGRALSSPYWQAVMGGVYQDDPQWSEQRAALRKDFTTGKHSSEINAINTAMGHVGVLGDAIDALHNSDEKALNRIANALGVQVGKNNVTTFNTIVHRVGPELSKAYIGAGGSAGERGSDEKDFDASLGPDALKSNVGITAQLLRSKIGSLENQWNQNKSDSMPSFQDHFISPEAKKQLDKWSPQGGGNTGGGGHVIRIGDKQYQYKGNGNTADLANYSEVTKK